MFADGTAFSIAYKVHNDNLNAENAKSIMMTDIFAIAAEPKVSHDNNFGSGNAN